MLDGYVQRFPDIFVSAEVELFFVFSGFFFLGLTLLVSCIFDIFIYRPIKKDIRALRGENK